MSAVSDVLRRAVAALAHEPEHPVASRLLAEILMRRDMPAARCTELPTLLAQSHDAGTILEWSS